MISYSTIHSLASMTALWPICIPLFCGFVVGMKLDHVEPTPAGIITTLDSNIDDSKNFFQLFDSLISTTADPLENGEVKDLEQEEYVKNVKEAFLNKTSQLNEDGEFKEESNENFYEIDDMESYARNLDLLRDPGTNLEEDKDRELPEADNIWSDEETGSTWTDAEWNANLVGYEEKELPRSDDLDTRNHYKRFSDPYYNDDHSFHFKGDGYEPFYGRLSNDPMRFSPLSRKDPYQRYDPGYIPPITYPSPVSKEDNSILRRKQSWSMTDITDMEAGRPKERSQRYFRNDIYDDSPLNSISEKNNINLNQDAYELPNEESDIDRMVTYDPLAATKEGWWSSTQVALDNLKDTTKPPTIAKVNDGDLMKSNETVLLGQEGQELLRTLEEKKGNLIEKLTLIQFSWVDIIISVSCTVAIILVFINMGVFLQYCAKQKIKSKPENDGLPPPPVPQRPNTFCVHMDSLRVRSPSRRKRNGCNLCPPLHCLSLKKDHTPLSNGTSISDISACTQNVATQYENMEAMIASFISSDLIVELNDRDSTCTSISEGFVYSKEYDLGKQDTSSGTEL